MKTRFHVLLPVLALSGFAANAVPVHAGTNVNVNLGIPVAVAVAPAPMNVAPQPVYVEQPPEMAIIPSLNVYFAPGVSVDLFFYDNRWWNRRGNRWYRASAYNGNWVAVDHRHIPAPVYRVPANYRTVYAHENRIPYGQWKKSHGKHGGKYKGEMHGNKKGHRDE